MKNILFTLLLAAIAAHANPYQPGSQQWHTYNALGAQMTEEMNQRNAAQQAAQQAAPSSAAPIVPHHQRPQWHPADNFAAIAIGHNPNADPARADNPPGVAAFYEHQNPRTAEEQARYRCFDSGAAHPDQCQILLTVRNLCAAAAQGRLRDQSGVRFHPAAAHNEPAAQQAALAQCQRDPAIHPASCTIATSGCALPTKTLR